MDWAESKAKVWGLAITTIENWLYTKESLATDVLAEAKSFPLEGKDIELGIEALKVLRHGRLIGPHHDPDLLPGETKD